MKYNYRIKILSLGGSLLQILKVIYDLDSKMTLKQAKHVTDRVRLNGEFTFYYHDEKKALALVNKLRDLDCEISISTY